MKRLIIDTATKNLYLALVDGETLLKEIKVVGERDHSQNIMIKIQEILKETTLNNIDEIIVGVGPGSYTGVRIGVTVAKMLAWSKDIKLYSVSSLLLMSSGYNGVVLSYIDARRGNAFVALFDNHKQIINDEHTSFKEYVDNINQKYSKYTLVTEDNFNVDVRYVINNAVLINNVHSLVPNYLRETEAERNLK